MQTAAVHRTIDAVFRIESAKLIAGLTRIVRDVGLAEELAQDSLVAALEQWPELGIPQNPGAWLMATAKNRAIDRLRKRKLVERKHGELAHALADAPDVRSEADRIEQSIDDPVGDDLLRLIFISCHPLLSMEARVALTLRLLGGLTTEEIARAFLTPETTIQQRIVRAKRMLADEKVPFEMPLANELQERLASVLEVIYLVFNEGYSATTGDDWMRPGLCEDAMRLGRILAELMTDEPEVHGLIALMELHASRSPARLGPSGEPILLLDQNRAKWDRLLIQRGLAALARADALGKGRGPYALQAAISACHARARVASDTDWRAIASLYWELNEILRSPIVELNRAIAVAMAEGPAAGLAIVDRLKSDLDGYHLFPSVRGDFLFKLGRLDEAKTEFQRAASLTRNSREQTLLLERANACGGITSA